MVHSPWVQPEKIATLISAVFLRSVTRVLGFKSQHLRDHVVQLLHEVDIIIIIIIISSLIYRSMSDKPSDTSACVCVFLSADEHF